MPWHHHQLLFGWLKTLPADNIGDQCDRPRVTWYSKCKINYVVCVTAHFTVGTPPPHVLTGQNTVRQLSSAQQPPTACHDNSWFFAILLIFLLTKLLAIVCCDDNKITSTCYVSHILNIHFCFIWYSMLQGVRGNKWPRKSKNRLPISRWHMDMC